MANQIYIPFSNPVDFYEVDKAELPQYISRHMDDVWLKDQLEEYETPVRYTQKWRTDDAIPFQYTSNFASIQVQLIDCQQNVILTQVVTQKRINKFISGYYLYENTISLANVPEGIYFILLKLGGGTKRMISEPQEVNNSIPGTLLFEYSNSRYHGDIVYETGIQFAFRIEGKFRNYQPESERTAYIDQKHNPTILNAIPFNTWEIIFGKNKGISDWAARKLNWIFSCDNVRIDGKPYAVVEDSQLDPNEFDPVYKLRSWTLRVQEGYNRASKIVGVEVDTTKRLLVGIAVDSTLFGDLSSQAGNNIINITDIE